MNDFINLVGNYFISFYTGLIILTPVFVIDAWLKTQYIEKGIDGLLNVLKRGSNREEEDLIDSEHE